jgi:acyl-CoA synthetase (AMP-forming)/AMP-acid ligase II
MVLGWALVGMGAIPVVIDPGMGLRKVSLALAKSRLQGIVASAPWLGALGKLMAACQGYGSKTFWGLRYCVGTRASHLKSWLSGYCSYGLFHPPDVTPETLAAIVFTSGSTGPAKGVCYTHGMLRAQVSLLQEHFPLNPGERDLTLLPLFTLLNPLLGGCTVVPKMDPGRPLSLNPAYMVSVIQRYGVTHSFGSPILWGKIAAWARQQGCFLPQMRRILMAGASAPVAVLRDIAHVAPKAALHMPYGATEALPVCDVTAQTVLGDTAFLTQQGQGTCLGKPLGCTRVGVVPWTSAPLVHLPAFLESGQVGELVVSGPHVTLAYDALPGATALAKCTDSTGTVWHRMGDLGYRDALGRFWFCGRKAECWLPDAPIPAQKQTSDDLCMAAPAVPETPLGQGYYTESWEGVLNAHPDVQRSALIAVHGRPWMVVQPRRWPFWPWQRRAQEATLLAYARACPATQGIAAVVLRRHLPVDVRHNTKIHRLSLARCYAS